MGFSIQKNKWKINFQGGGHVGQIGFPIGKIILIFDLQVTAKLPAKFQVNWSFGSDGQSKTIF